MKLKLTNGPEVGREIKLADQRIALGRETDNDVQILVGGVSRYHAEISKSGDKWIIRDLGSTNGIKVDADKISGEKDLFPGAMLNLGDQSIVVIGEDGDPKPEKEQIITEEKSDSEDKKSESEPEEKAENSDKKDVSTLMFTPESSEKEKIENSEEDDSSFKNIIPETPDKADSEDDSIEKNAQEKKEDVSKSFENSFESSKNENEENEENEATVDDIKAINLFGTGENKSQKVNGKAKKSNKMSNLIFYTVVVSLATIFIAVFIKTQSSSANGNPAIENLPEKNADEPENGSSESAELSIPSAICYLRKKSSSDNVFRFSFVYKEQSIHVTIDDLKHGIHAVRKVAEINDEMKTGLTRLAEQIEKSGFMQIQEPEPGFAAEDKNNLKKLTVASDSKLKKIEVLNTFSPAEFESIERAIEDFCSDFLNLHALTLTPEEMREEAEISFKEAEVLYKNANAAPENLYKAAEAYDLAIKMLDPFEPKPRIYTVAVENKRKAKSELNNKIDKLGKEAKRLYMRKQYREAKEKYMYVLEMIDVNDPRYKRAKNEIKILEKLIRQRDERR